MRGKSRIWAIFLVLLFNPFVVADFEPDSDDDSDGWDCDGDGVVEPFTNLDEFNANTNPLDPDTDDDGTWDGWEVCYDFNPLDSSDGTEDSDFDNLQNWQEFLNSTHPRNSDTDNDDIPDDWEVNYSTNVLGLDGCMSPLDPSDASQDLDGDNLTGLEEYQLNTNPCDADSDDDGNNDDNDPPPVDPGDGDDESPPDTGSTDGNPPMYEYCEPALGQEKRWSVKDSVNPDNYGMYSYGWANDEEPTEIPVTNNWDHTYVFDCWIWNNITVAPDEYAAIPSPSPQSEIIAYEVVDSNVELAFFVDGTENYYIQPTNMFAEDDIELKYWIGTDGSYFEYKQLGYDFSNVPDDLTVDDIPQDSSETFPKPFPHSELDIKVQEFLQYRNNTTNEIVNPSLYNLWPEDGEKETNLKLIADNLTNYFSAFTEGDGDVPDPEDPWDIYQTICVNGIGACRHRSFAFFVTANALELPTRYVSNEGHAFVEVYIPSTSDSYNVDDWKINNLGGTGGSTDFPRPDDDECEDTFRFGRDDPEAIAFMCGDEINVVLEGISPSLPDSVDKLGYEEGDDDGTNLVVTGYVETMNGTPLSDVQIGLGMRDFDDAYDFVDMGSTTSDAAGTFSAELTVPGGIRVGTTKVYAASYSAGYKHHDNITDFHLTVVDSDTAVFADIPSSIANGDTLVITGVLNDIGGLELSNQSVSFYMTQSQQGSSTECYQSWWGGTEYCYMGNTTTDEMGNYVWDDHTWGGCVYGDSEYCGNRTGTWNLIVYFPGSANLRSSYVSDQIRVKEETVDLEAEISPLVTIVGEEFTVIGNISEAAVNNGSIVISFNDEEWGSFIPTESNFTFNVTTPSNIEVGNYTISVKFQPNDDEDGELYPEEIVPLEIRVRGTSTLSLDIVGIILRGQTAYLNGTLVNHLSEGLADQSVTIYWSGSELGTLITDSNGFFSYEHFLDLNETLGVNNWSATFNDTYWYVGSSAEKQVVVKQQPILVLDNEIQSFFSEYGFWVNGTITADNGSAFPSSLGLFWNPGSNFLPKLNFDTDENGTFSFYYTPEMVWLQEEDVGNHTIRIQYDSVGYNESAYEDMFVELHRKVALDIDEGSDSKRGNTITISGSARVNDSSMYPISGLPIELEWSQTGVSFSIGNVTTNSDGTFFYDFTIPDSAQLGEVKILAVYNSTNADFRFYESPVQVETDYRIFADVVITIEEYSAYRGDIIWFNGTLLDDVGNSVPEELAEVYVFWGGSSVPKFTINSFNETGHFSYAYDPLEDTENQNLGPIEITANFYGIQYYNDAETTSTVYVWGYTEITFTDFTSIVTSGDIIYFSGNVTNDLGENITILVDFYLNDTIRISVQAIDGIFNGAYQVPIDEPKGDVSFNATTVPDSAYLESDTDTVSIRIQRATQFELDWNGGYREENSTVSGYLRDSSGSGLHNQTISVLLDGVLLENVTTEQFGLFTYNLTNPSELGNYTISVEFMGTDYYLSSNMSTSAKIISSTSIFTQPIEATRSYSFVVSAILIDDKGMPVAGQEVTVKIFEIDYTLVTNDDGLASITLNLSAETPWHNSTMLGVSNAEWTYMGSEFYEPSEALQQVTIYAATFISLEVFDFVIAGNNLHIQGYIIDDLNAGFETELSIFLPDGVVNVTSSSSGFFQYNYLTPLEVEAGIYVLNVSFEGSSVYFGSSDSDEFRVIHDTVISLETTEATLNTTNYIEGTVLDQLGRPVDNITVHITLNNLTTTFGQTDSNGSFSLPFFIPSSHDIGPSYLFINVTSTDIYFGNISDENIILNSITLLEIATPIALEPDQDFTGTVILLMEDGTPISNGSLIVELYNSNMEAPSKVLITTDENGIAKFDASFSGNQTIPMNVTVYYNGGEYLLESSTSSSIVYRAPEVPINIFPYVAVLVAILGVIGSVYGYNWYKNRHLRELKDIIASTADSLVDDSDYRQIILNSYKKMCRVLQSHGYLRRSFETVREFEKALQQAIPIDQESLNLLTRLYEVADYSESIPKSMDRDTAVNSLRTVLESIESLIETSGG